MFLVRADRCALSNSRLRKITLFLFVVFLQSVLAACPVFAQSSSSSSDSNWNYDTGDQSSSSYDSSMDSSSSSSSSDSSWDYDTGDQYSSAYTTYSSTSSVLTSSFSSAGCGSVSIPEAPAAPSEAEGLTAQVTENFNQSTGTRTRIWNYASSDNDLIGTEEDIEIIEEKKYTFYYDTCTWVNTYTSILRYGTNKWIDLSTNEVMVDEFTSNELRTWSSLFDEPRTEEYSYVVSEEYFEGKLQKARQVSTVPSGRYGFEESYTYDPDGNCIHEDRTEYYGSDDLTLPRPSNVCSFEYPRGG